MTHLYEMQNIPAVGQYVTGLTRIRSSITDLHIKAFQAHYQAPNYSATAKQLALMTGISGGHAQINSLYALIALIVGGQSGHQDGKHPRDLSGNCYHQSRKHLNNWAGSKQQYLRLRMKSFPTRFCLKGAYIA